MHPSIVAIEYFLPEQVITTADLAASFPEWSIASIDKKTGIRRRHIAAADECASDLAARAAGSLFSSGVCLPDEVDFLLFCTQSADYVLPTTACLLQDRLGLSTRIGAFDFNLGCSGYIYGLGVASALIESRQAQTVLLLTADTYSKYIAVDDKACRSIFGDGGTATLIRGYEGETSNFGPFIYGTDGRGGDKLMVPNSANRHSTLDVDEDLPYMGRSRLVMDGQSVFQFALDTVPRAVEDLLEKAHLVLEDISLFIFHQANAYMLEAIRETLAIPNEKFYISMADSANTVSSTIPIALKDAFAQGRVLPGQWLMLVGFGVGYSWGGTIIKCEGL